jgi:predicted nucleic acid-binding protein
VAIASVPDGSTVYVDTPPLIYVIEEHPVYAPRLVSVFERIDAGVLTAVTSYVTLTEVLVKPYAEVRGDLIRRYRDVLTASSNFAVLPVDEDVAVEAARIRGAHGIRLADAIHLGTATAARADVFITNDDRLKRFGELRVITVDELDDPDVEE